MRTGPAAVAALILAAAVLPGALAEHAYSHQYRLRGRVLDAVGLPIVGLKLEVGTRGVPVLGPCTGFTAADRTTDDYGDFEACLHVHEFPPNAGLSLLIHGDEQAAPVDADLRVTTFFLKVANLTGSPYPADWNRTYLVEGRVWQSTEPGRVDGVPVRGVALPNETVRLTLAAAGAVFRVNATTNEHGDYAVRFHLPFDLHDGNMTASANGVERTAPVIVAFMRQRLDLRANGSGPHPRLDAPEAVDVNFPSRAARGEAPGSASAPFLGSPVSWILAAGIAIGATAAVAFARRSR